MKGFRRSAWIGLLAVAGCGGVPADGDETSAPAPKSDEVQVIERPGAIAEVDAIPPLPPGDTGPRALPAPAHGKAEVGPAGAAPAAEATSVVEDVPAAEAPASFTTGATCPYFFVNHGGRVIAHPRIHRVFWGSAWSQWPRYFESISYNATWSNLANTAAFYNRVAEYGIGQGSSGNRFDISTGATGAVAETTFQDGLVSALAAASYTPTDDDIFVIFLPPGTTSQYDTDNNGAGHHYSFYGLVNYAFHDIVYAVLEYQTSSDTLNMNVSHEIMEAATDPDIYSYFDTVTNPAQEVGDVCWHQSAKIAGYTVEKVWSQAVCRCVGERDLSGYDPDGDGKVAPAVYRPGNPGVWFASGAPTAWAYGQTGDVPVPGDFTGDGRTEMNLYRPSTGQWLIANAATGVYEVRTLGQPGDIAVPADYDGDGKTDIAVWTPSTGNWTIVQSSNGAQVVTQWGAPGDAPVPADYDGDGKADCAVRRPSASTWYVLLSGSPGYYTWATWGVPTDKAVTGDFNGDGKCDWALWRPSEGRFYVNYKDTSEAYYTWAGWSGSVPVARDYDGDLRTDVATFDPTSGYWYIVPSSTGVMQYILYGQSGDIPVMRMPQ